MSEERKKSRAWILLAIGLLLVMYPLSMGPVMGLAARHGQSGKIFFIYKPILWVIRSSPFVDDVMNRYLHHWGIGAH